VFEISEKVFAGKPCTVPWLEVSLHRRASRPPTRAGRRIEARKPVHECTVLPGLPIVLRAAWLRLSRLPRLSSTRPADLAGRMSTRSAEGEASPPGPSAADACASGHEGTHPCQALSARMMVPTMHASHSAIDMCMCVSCAMTATQPHNARTDARSACTSRWSEHRRYFASVVAAALRASDPRTPQQ